MIAIFFDYHMAECDCCGHFLPAEKTDAAAETAMRAAGWEKRDGVDICPMCLRKERETGTLPGRRLFWKYTKHLTERRNADGRESIADRAAVHSGAP